MKNGGFRDMSPRVGELRERGRAQRLCLSVDSDGRAQWAHPGERVQVLRANGGRVRGTVRELEPELMVMDTPEGERRVRVDDVVEYRVLESPFGTGRLGIRFVDDGSEVG